MASDVKTEFEEKLIGCVHIKPELYDKTKPNYKNDVLKASIWAEIGLELIKDGKECKKAWDSLRSQYTAYLRKLKNPTGSGKKQPPYFRHSDSMQFLLDFVEPRKTESNVDVDSLESEQNSPTTPDSSQQEVIAVVNDDTQEEQVLLVNNVKSPENRTDRKRNRTSNSSSVLESKLLKGLDSLTSTEDEHEKFLLSLAPAFRRLNPRKAAETRIKFQQILFEAEFD